MILWSCYVFRLVVVKFSIVFIYFGIIFYVRLEGDDFYLFFMRSFFVDILNVIVGYVMFWIFFSFVGYLESGWFLVFIKWFFGVFLVIVLWWCE